MNIVFLALGILLAFSVVRDSKEYFAEELDTATNIRTTTILALTSLYCFLCATPATWRENAFDGLLAPWLGAGPFLGFLLANLAVSYVIFMWCLGQGTMLFKPNPDAGMFRFTVEVDESKEGAPFSLAPIQALSPEYKILFAMMGVMLFFPLGLLLVFGDSLIIGLFVLGSVAIKLIGFCFD